MTRLSTYAVEEQVLIIELLDTIDSPETDISDLNVPVDSGLTAEEAAAVVVAVRVDETERAAGSDAVNILPVLDKKTCHLCKKSFKNKRGKMTNLKSCEKKHALIAPPIAGDLNAVNATDIGHLPPNTTTFATTKEAVNAAYEFIVHWRRNMFTLPKGHVGKLFVQEMTALINSWCSKSEWHEIAMKSLMIMPSLLLQKPSPKSKSQVNKHQLERRITLCREASAIQQRLKSTTRTISAGDRSRKFANFVIND